jgi:hypothetical protein
MAGLAGAIIDVEAGRVRGPSQHKPMVGGRLLPVPRSLFPVRCSLGLFGVWWKSDCATIGGRFESVGRISGGLLRYD